MNAAAKLPRNFMSWLRRRPAMQGIFLAAPTGIWLFLFLGLPLILVLLYSFWIHVPGELVERRFTLENYERFLTRPIYGRILLRSFRVGLETAILSLILAYPTAYYLAKRRSGSTMLIFLILVPFWTSYLIRLFSWMLILMEQGVANGILLSLGIISEPLRLLFTPFAVVIGLIYSALPFTILPIYAVLRGIDPELVPAAKMLGATDFQSFLEVTLPLSVPGIMTALIITFISGAGSFLAPAILGGKGADLMSNVIVNRFLEAFDWPFGSALGIVLLVTTIVLLMIVSKYVALDKIYGPGK
ncbi:MAG: spermidine/putrescine ABC transporter permease PotB [Anaerolineae bacterium]|nr:MAG: spermidine/putrescine ABC transporter permease PotB [Anaerolineae bacterium]